MVKAYYWQKGETLDFKNNTQNVIDAGLLIPVGLKVGVTGNKMNPGDMGTLHMVGVFFVEKTTQVFNAGELVYLEENGITGNPKTGEADNPQVGYVVVEASASDTTVAIKLMG